MQTAYNIGNNIGVFLYTAREGKTPSDIQPVIKAAVRKNHPIDPTDEDAFWFMDISEQFKMVENLFLGVKILALFVGFGTLLAGVIGVGNIMWIIVKERTQEIGIRRQADFRPRARLGAFPARFLECRDNSCALPCARHRRRNHSVSESNAHQTY